MSTGDAGPARHRRDREWTPTGIGRHQDSTREDAANSHDPAHLPDHLRHRRLASLPPPAPHQDPAAGRVHRRQRPGRQHRRPRPVGPALARGQQRRPADARRRGRDRRGQLRQQARRPDPGRADRPERAPAAHVGEHLAGHRGRPRRLGYRVLPGTRRHRRAQSRRGGDRDCAAPAPLRRGVPLGPPRGPGLPVVHPGRRAGPGWRGARRRRAARAPSAVAGLARHHRLGHPGRRRT